MKIHFLLACFVFINQLAAQDKVTEYVDKYKFIAIAEMERAGIPASIKMAQGILESGIGVSELATTANNHFGIKCGGDWVGGSHFVWDDEPVKSCFRVYLSPEESYIAHSEFLLNPAKQFRYGFLFQISKFDYKAWAKGLQSSGYATSKTYSEKLISLIERYELYKLDHLTLKTAKISDIELQKIQLWQHDISQDTTPLEHRIDTAQIDTFKAAEPFPPVLPSFWETWQAVHHPQRNPHKEFEINKLPVAILNKNQTVADFCQRHKVKKSKLWKYNELKTNQLQTAQYLYLRPKRKSYTGAETQHKITSFESWYEISQLYGIKIKSLKKLNPDFRRRIPTKGDSIRLRKG